MKERYSFAVIGAGPAGLTAATVAAQAGLDVAVFDEQPTPGGQIYRATETIPARRAEQLGTEYQRGAGIIGDFRRSGAQYFPETRVWSLSERGEIGLTREGRSRMVSADQVLIATGAMERPLPFPGWTLPGVMNAGAGQILFKAQGIAPAQGVVLAGSGPLLLLLAWQYLQAGVSILGVLDTAPLANHLRSAPHLPRAMLAGHYITKGLSYKRDLKKAGVRFRHGVRELRALGGTRLEGIGFVHKSRQQRLETGLLLTHFGVIPATQLSQAAGCRHFWDRNQQCWRPRLDPWGSTSIGGILVAGDGGGIGGARAAEHAGRLAAFQALHTLGRMDEIARDRAALQDREWMLEDLRIRPFLEAFFRIPRDMLSVPDDTTLICRCEEVSAGEVRAAVADGHRDSNQVKFLTRCGMGPCQGRQCNDPVGQIVADATGTRVEAAGHYRVRPPVKPLTLGELAGLFPDEQE